ncbi:MAG: class I SAM-dependent methyltransferase [Mycobacterium sp.]
MTSPSAFRHDPDMFDKLYRGEPTFDGAPPPGGIPWDVGQAQPRLMELEALGGISGEVLDIGCGLGDNAIFLASKGYSVTALDGSAAAIETARSRADEAGALAAPPAGGGVTFGVADATNLSGFDGRFDTVVDSALYHCLDDAGQRSYATGVHRATRPGARWHLYCFSEGNVNGAIAPRPVPEDSIRDTLTGSGWRIDFLGPTTYLANSGAMGGDPDDMPEATRQQMPPEQIAHMQDMGRRFAAIVPLLDGERIHLPITVVHAVRVD